MKKIMLLSLIFLMIIKLNAQTEHFELEANTGWVFFNLLNDPVVEYDDLYTGYGLQNSFDIWLSQTFGNNHNFKIGLGYTNYYYLDFVVIDPSSYANFRIATELQTPFKKWKFTSSLSNHIYLHKYNEDRLDFQRRVFTKLDLGLKYKMSNRLSLHLSSPLTIFPMFQDDNSKGFVTPNGILPADGHVELTGLNVGLSYAFKPHQRDFLRPMKTKGMPQNFAIELSSGLIRYDLFNEKEDFDKYFEGTGRQLSADIWYKKSIYQNVALKVGAGYSTITYNQPFLDTIKNFSAINARIGGDFQTKWEPLSINATVSNYIFTEKELDRLQRRIMTNLELGANFQITDNIGVRLTTPITISAMYYSGLWNYINSNGDNKLIQKSYVGMTGINLGLVYNFR